MTTPVTKLVTANPVLLFGGRGSNTSPVQVTNLSTTITVWVSNASNVAADGTNGVPIGPLASLSFDGSVSIYAIAVGGTASVMLVPGGTAYAPGSLAITGTVNASVNGNVNITGQSLALDVSAQTVSITPTGSGYVNPGQTVNLLTDTTGKTVLPGTSQNETSIDARKYTSVGVYIQAYNTAQSTMGASLTGHLRLTWYDDAGLTYPVYVEDACFWIGNGVGHPFNMSGVMPVHGAYLVVSVFNDGTAGNIVYNPIVVNGSFRTPVYSSWRQAAPSTSLSAIVCNSVTLANLSASSATYSGNLGDLASVTPGTGLRAYLLPLFAGPVSLFYAINTAALVNTPTIVDCSYVTSGNLAAGTNQAGLIWTGPNTAGQSDTRIINLPRSPCALVVNPAATSSIQFSVVGQQGY